MELRHLRYFVAAAEEENVTRAAERLHVSQPPLTRQIQDLEAELGVQLFTRTGKSIRLTDAGRIFLKEARAALERVDAAIRTVRAAAGAEKELCVGYAPSPTASFLPAVLRAFQKKAPQVRVTLCEHSSAEMIAGLREGRLHAAFLVKPQKLAMRGLNFESLATFPVVVAMAPDHPLARCHTVSLRDVLACPMVAYSRKIYPDYHAFLAGISGTLKRQPFVEECDSGTSLTAAIESGRGIAITMSSFATVAAGKLRFVPITPAPAPGVVGIAWRTKGLSPLASEFIQTTRDLISAAVIPPTSSAKKDRSGWK